MPLELPRLDDLDYAHLLEEARASLPAYDASWTDHNPSDPGITLVELLAWLTETVLYRIDQVGDDSHRNFLKLLRGEAPPDGQDLGEAAFQTVRALRERYRAVTPADFESLVNEVYPASPFFVAPQPRRVRCLGERNCEAVGSGKYNAAPGHVSLVLLPDGPDGAPWQQPAAAVLGAVKLFLNERRLLTTRLHVVGPTYVDIIPRATLHLNEDAVVADVRREAAAALFSAFHPLRGGGDGKGWPLGRNVHVSEVYTVLDAVRGVDFVEGVDLAVQDASRKEREEGALVAVRLFADELPRVRTPDDDPLLKLSLTTLEKRGGTWVPTES
jgi:hypothetical protein